MTIQSSEVLKSLIDVREEFGIPLIHIGPAQNFVIYRASGGTNVFHLTVCTALTDLPNPNYFRRTSDTSGVFQMLDGTSKHLSVCTYCLKKLNWKGFNAADKKTQKSIRENFSIEEFFREN